MISTPTFAEKIATYKTSIMQLENVTDASRIQYTAKRLEGLYFSPTLILSTERFLYLSKADILEEIDRVAALPDQEMQEQGFDTTQDFHQIKLEHLGLLVYHFTLLTRLRQDDPEAWDEIDELYGDD